MSVHVLPIFRTVEAVLALTIVRLNRCGFSRVDNISSNAHSSHSTTNCCQTIAIWPLSWTPTMEFALKLLLPVVQQKQQQWSKSVGGERGRQNVKVMTASVRKSAHPRWSKDFWRTNASHPVSVNFNAISLLFLPRFELNWIDITSRPTPLSHLSFWKNWWRQRRGKCTSGNHSARGFFHLIDSNRHK